MWRKGNGGAKSRIGPQAAVYREASVLFGAKEMEARNLGLEFRPPCIEGPRKERRRRGGSGLDRRKLATPTPLGGEKQKNYLS